MRALETIAESIRIGYVHPTVILNTLIEVENEGGLPALQSVEQRLENGMYALRLRQHPNHELAANWLKATRRYLVSVDNSQAV